METSDSRIFISLQLASNNRTKILRLLNNLEERTDRPNILEVLVKVDEEDGEICALMAQQAKHRPFSLRYFVTPRGGGFKHLWKASNELYKQTSDSAYFVCLISDEIEFDQSGWDSILRNYVGIYPDHIFRLRTTQLKLRNYYDFWECGYAPDSYAFYTKRWLDIVGDWNPCTGADSSQQFIAYYLGYGTYPGFRQFNRDVPIMDLSFSREGASHGMTDEERQRRNTIYFREWFRLVSHPMQEELYRRARLLQAHIIAAEQSGRTIDIECDTKARMIVLRESESWEILDMLPFRLSRVRLWFANVRRTLHYHYYAGGGPSSWNMLPFSVIDLLTVYYPRMRRLIAPLITSKTYWITKEMCALVAQTFRQRQPRLFVRLVERFGQRHAEWHKSHCIAYWVICRLLSFARFVDRAMIVSGKRRLRRIPQNPVETGG